LTYLIKEAKIKHYKTEIRESGNNTKLKWQFINDIIAKNSKTNNLKELLSSININTEPNDREPAYILADTFYNYFINVASDLVMQLKNYKNINNFSTSYQFNITTFFNNTSLNNFKITAFSDILESTSKLKNGSSTGIDQISSNLLKKSIIFIYKPLIFPTNLCVTQNKIPYIFKVALITPIHKKDITSSLNNFRPISVISNTAKIFGKIIKTSLIHSLETNNLLFKNQFGFRPNKSTDHGLENVTKLIFGAHEEGKKCATIYIDFTKAFDTVDHDKLLKNA